MRILNEDLKAIEEISKTTGKAIDAGMEFGAFISKYMGYIRTGIWDVEDKLKYMRWERQARLMLRAKEFMHDMGTESPTKPIPLKLAIPFFQGASLEEDNYLQDLWAKLLVNSSNIDSRINLNRMFIDILERISVLEAIILQTIYSSYSNDIEFNNMLHEKICTSRLPEEVYFEEDNKDYDKLENEEVLITLINLSRIGCISPSMSFGGGEIYDVINPMYLGKRFIDACTLTKKVD